MKTPQTFRHLGVVLVLAALTGCNEGSTNPPVDPNAPAQVQIQQEDFRLLVGTQRALTAEVRSGTGAPLSTTVEWVSGSPTVAVVNGAGLVQALSGGQSTIFATAGLGQDSVIVTVPDPAGAVSSSGGVVLSPDGVVRLDVPANSVPAPVTITITPAHPDSLPSGSQVLAGTAYEFGPAGLTFALGATLTIGYNPSLVTASEAQRLRLHKLSGSSWVEVAGGSVDADESLVSGPITSFSIYGIALTPNRVPEAAITSPADGAEVASGSAVAFAGSATDEEDGTLAGDDLVWTSSLDGELGTGASFTRTDLSIGEHVITLSATDADGSTGTAQVTVTVVDGPPVVTIAEPSADTVTKVGDPVVFRGSATDHVDGAISADSLSWTSSLDGALGTGDSITAASLSLGEHVITLTARDSNGNAGEATVSVSVQSNAPPVVTINSPVSGASVGDRSGATLRGTAIDPEDGALSGSALTWTSSLDGVLGTGTDVAVTGLTVGSHTVTLTATDPDGAVGSASVTFAVYAEPPPLLYPQLVYVGEAAGTLTLSVSNNTSYDPQLFVLDNTLPPCGADPNGGRTWVEVYDENDALLATFCDFDSRTDMASFSFTPATPPARVYVELWDRRLNRRVRSASVVPTPTVGTSIHGVVVNDRDADLNTLDPGEALSGVTIQLIVDTNADGVIDAGEAIWGSTTTNGSGAYSFSGLWQRNYIVRALSPSNATVLRSLSPTGDVVAQTGTLLTTGVAGAGATLNQSGTSQVGNTSPPAQGDELPRWDYAAGTAATDTGSEPSGPGPNNGALTTRPTHFVFLYSTGTITGTVTSGGAGVSGALVTATRCQTAPSAPTQPTAGACTQKHGSPSPHIANVTTGSSGGYTVGGLLEGVYQIEVAPLTAGYSAVVTPGGGTYLAVVRGDGGVANIPDFVLN